MKKNKGYGKRQMGRKMLEGKREERVEGLIWERKRYYKRNGWGLEGK